ncbi:MAG: site-specific DNA-methyltransferase [Candidatus Latescibacteria bacterium]|nr:site-specific DNA-methyltransferase [Candidatus Latescibacterota bacterium]
MHQEQIENIQIYNDDCVKGMRTYLDAESIDVVVTSPPYNLGTRYKAYDDTIPRTDYLDWMETWATEIHRVLSDDGSLFLNIGAKPSDPGVPFEVLSRMQNHFALQNVIHWIKSIAIQKEDVGNYPHITGNIGVGHFKPINSPRFINDCHEYIFHLTKHQNVKLDRLSIGVEYQDKSNIARWKSAGKDRRCRGNTWFVPYKTIKNRAKQRPHPATFPAKIPKMCIQLHGIEDVHMILDPFLGIGNTALACLELGLPCTGFELDPDYYAEAKRFIQEYQPTIV